MCGELTSTSSMGSEYDFNLQPYNCKAQTHTTAPSCYPAPSSHKTTVVVPLNDFWFLLQGLQRIIVHLSWRLNSGKTDRITNHDIIPKYSLAHFPSKYSNYLPHSIFYPRLNLLVPFVNKPLSSIIGPKMEDRLWNNRILIHDFRLYQSSAMEDTNCDYEEALLIEGSKRLRFTKKSCSWNLLMESEYWPQSCHHHLSRI